MRDMRRKHHGREIEDASCDQHENRIRQPGPSIPQRLAAVAKDTVLAELELSIKSQSAFNTQLCFKTVNSTMPVYKAKNH